MPNNMVLLILLCLCIAVVANLYCQRDGAYIQGKSIALSRSVRAFLGKTNWGGKIPQETVCHHAAGDPNTTSWGKNQWCLLIFLLSLPPPLSLFINASILLICQTQASLICHYWLKPCNSQRTSRTSVPDGDSWEPEFCVSRSCQILSFSSVLSPVTGLPSPVDSKPSDEVHWKKYWFCSSRENCLMNLANSGSNCLIFYLLCIGLYLYLISLKIFFPQVIRMGLLTQDLC